MAAAVVLLGGILVAAGTQLQRNATLRSGHQESMAFEELLALVATTAGLAIILWWALALAVAFASALMARAGLRRGSAAASRLTPAFMRRLALAAVGLQLITAPLATAASPSGRSGSPDPSPPPAAVSAAWTPTTALDRLRLANRPPTPPQPVPWRPQPPVTPPGPLAAEPLRPPSDDGTAVTVRTGDSLWTLAAETLGPFASDVDIAHEWPRWYAHNRAVIGADPNLLQPGQILRVPAPSAEP